jgi:hypothetical protein
MMCAVVSNHHLYKSSQLDFILFDKNFPGPLVDKLARNSSALNAGRGGGSKNGGEPSEGLSPKIWTKRGQKVGSELQEMPPQYLIVNN